MPLLDKLIYQKNKLNLKSEDIASQADVPIGTLNKILTGETKNPTAKTISKIARVLGVSTEYLLNDSIPIEPKIEDLLSGDELQQKKAPNSEDSESEADDRYSLEEIFMGLYTTLTKIGILKPGKDLTPVQTEILLSFIRMINASIEEEQ